MEPYPVPNVMKQDIRKILSEVSFVDKIVFGKWNYNRKISNFKSYKQFYNSMAYEVVRFCTENSIDVHIKEGTINLDHLAPRQSLERKLLANYV
jgi:hypothetical protein